MPNFSVSENRNWELTLSIYELPSLYCISVDYFRYFCLLGDQGRSTLIPLLLTLALFIPLVSIIRIHKFLEIQIDAIGYLNWVYLIMYKLNKNLYGLFRTVV